MKQNLMKIEIEKSTIRDFGIPPSAINRTRRQKRI